MSQSDGKGNCNLFEYRNYTADDAIPGHQSRQKNVRISPNTSKHKTAVLQRNTRGNTHTHIYMYIYLYYNGVIVKAKYHLLQVEWSFRTHVNKYFTPICDDR